MCLVCFAQCCSTESNLLLLIKLERLCYSWDEENAGAEWIVKGENETSGKKQSFLDVYGFSNRKCFNLCFDGFGLHENLKYIKVCSHLELFLWWHAEPSLKDSS